MLTGEVGAGKTTLSRALVDAFAERCRFSFVVHPALPPAQLLGADRGGVRPPARRGARPTCSRALAEHVARLDAEGRFAVVVVDEAQLLPGRAAFDELRLLTNLAADDRALVGLVLVGQPELRDAAPRAGRRGVRAADRDRLPRRRARREETGPLPRPPARGRRAGGAALRRRARSPRCTGSPAACRAA